MKKSYIDKLSPQEKEEYEKLDRENEELTRGIEKMKAELKGTKEQIEVQMQNINLSKVS